MMAVELTRETSYSITVIPSHSPPLGHYKITGKIISKPVCILFARHSSSKETVSVVLKLLYEYKDTRYNLATAHNRQRCQLEALQWNRIFTPDIHMGLAHICKLDYDRKGIEIDEIIENPSMETLAPKTEYALLMRQLPTSRRLDYILTEEANLPLQRYIQLLVKYVVHIHTNLEALSIRMEDAEKWGSSAQLRKKLLHNMKFLDQIMVKSNHGECRAFYWLKDRLLRVFKLIKDLKYFEQRIYKGRIKHCHADLKSPNIWIAPLPLPGTPNEYWYDKEPWRFIYLLDAIDFNPMYSYIDVLSDFAMLVTDIHARTKSRELADCMIEHYLELTNQNDEVSRLLLAYYLVEKAIIGAVISILYDKVPAVGLDFLKTAEMRMGDLEHQTSIRRYLYDVKSPILPAIPGVDLIADKANAREDNTIKKGSETTKRRKFTEEFKEQVVLELMSEARSRAELCREHKLSRQTLWRWKIKYLPSLPKRIAELEKLVDQDAKKLEMAKKASAILSIPFDGAEIIRDGDPGT